jgi:mannitol 2-dehydrogenase
MTSLRAANLGSITSAAIPVYDRSAASVGIVHIGFGNFHRSHEAMYIDRLMEQGEASEWGICGVGILPSDAAMRDAMRAQDCLYTLVLRHADGRLEPRIIGSVLDYRFGPDDPEAVLQVMCDPAVRIVSLTVTESGYVKDPATGAFDPQHADVRHDLANPKTPRTAFAYVVEALRRRRAAGIAPFTVLSCDNLQGNGDVAHQAVTGFARLLDPELADWIDAEVAFPNSMVDRITPATTEHDREAVEREFGIVDLWPVPAEPFTQWIVEDTFTTGRPELERVGVQFVPDVRPYEEMKLRLLNGSHQAIAYLGGLLGCVFVDEALRDDGVRAFLDDYMWEEAIPTLAPVPGVDLEKYVNTLLERFSNPHMRDTILRLATDGANRMATFVLPTVRDNLIAGRPMPRGMLLLAAWAEYWVRIARGEVPQADIPADVLGQELARAAVDPDAVAFIELTPIFGGLAGNARLREPFLAARTLLTEVGISAALDRVRART